MESYHWCARDSGIEDSQVRNWLWKSMIIVKTFLNFGVICFRFIFCFRWKLQTFDKTTEDRHRIDAVATERLTSSKHVIDIYGHCGQSVINEFAEEGSLLEYVKKHPTSRDKLTMARDVALGIANVHEFEGEGNATIVHRDLKPANIVVLKGQPKLNDFNDAEFLQWHTVLQRRCGFRRKRWTPTVRL